MYRIALSTDGRVNLIEEAIHASVPISDFQKLLADTSKMPLFTGILPSGTVLYAQTLDDIHYLVELPPDNYLIKTANMEHGVKVPLPWQYFMFRFSKRHSGYPEEFGEWMFQEGFLFWKESRLTSPEDNSVIAARVPNVDGQGVICFGTTYPESNLSVAERINTLVNEFYSPASVFNEDLQWNLPRAYTSFLDWADAGKANPLCWKSWREWADHKISLNDYFPSQLRAIADTSNPTSIPLTFDQIRRQLRAMGAQW